MPWYLIVLFYDPKRRLFEGRTDHPERFSTHLSTFLSTNRFENTFRTVCSAFQNVPSHLLKPKGRILLSRIYHMG